MEGLALEPTFLQCRDYCQLVLYVNGVCSPKQLCTRNLYFSDSEMEDTDMLQPDGTPYKGDAVIPVFCWSKTAFSALKLLTLLLGSYEQEYLCISQPVKVENNVSFLVV